MSDKTEGDEKPRHSEDLGEYQIALWYRAGECPYTKGDFITSPVTDGQGRLRRFPGVGVVIAVASSIDRGVEAVHVFVRLSTPLKR